MILQTSLKTLKILTKDSKITILIFVCENQTIERTRKWRKCENKIYEICFAFLIEKETHHPFFLIFLFYIEAYENLLFFGQGKKNTDQKTAEILPTAFS